MRYGRWMGALGVGFGLTAVWACLALGLPPAVAAVQMAATGLGVWGAVLAPRNPGAGLALLLLGALGTPLFLILAVPAGLAWWRTRRPAAGTPAGTAR